MSQFISLANVFGDQHVLSLTAVSPSFQSALTPWLLTVASEIAKLQHTDTYKSRYFNKENYEQNFQRFSHIKVLAQNSTFQFTRSISLEADDDQTKHEMLTSSSSDEKCALRPLFSHLQSLTLLLSSFGKASKSEQDDTIKFVLNFQRLQKITLCVEQWSDPEAVLDMNMKLLTSNKFKSNGPLLSSLLISFARNLTMSMPSDRESVYTKLLKEKNIPEMLQELMLEVYSKNSQGSQCIAAFLVAIRATFSIGMNCSHDHIIRRITDAREGTHEELAVLSPTLDMIETVIVNKDVFHPSFADLAEPNPSRRKFSLANEIVKTFVRMMNRHRVQLVQLVQRHGATILIQLSHLTVEHDDGSHCAMDTLTSILAVYAEVIPDTFWVAAADEPSIDPDEYEFSNSAFQVMIASGRRCLEHFPFENLAHVLKKTWHCSSNKFPSNLIAVVGEIDEYIRKVQVGSQDRNAEAVVNVAERMNQHDIPHLLLNFLAIFFDRNRSTDWAVYPSKAVSIFNSLLGAGQQIESDHNNEESEEEDVKKQDQWTPSSDPFSKTLRDHFFKNGINSIEMHLAMNLIRSSADCFDRLIDDDMDDKRDRLLDPNKFQWDTKPSAALKAYIPFAKETIELVKLLRHNLNTNSGVNDKTSTSLAGASSQRRRARDTNEEDEIAILRRTLMYSELDQLAELMQSGLNQCTELEHYMTQREVVFEENVIYGDDLEPKRNKNESSMDFFSRILSSQRVGGGSTGSLVYTHNSSDEDAEEEEEEDAEEDEEEEEETP